MCWSSSRYCLLHLSGVRLASRLGLIGPRLATNVGAGAVVAGMASLVVAGVSLAAGLGTKCASSVSALMQRFISIRKQEGTKPDWYEQQRAKFAPQVATSQASRVARDGPLRNYDEPPQQRTATTWTNRLGVRDKAMIAGAAIMAVAAFLPLASVPVFGSFNYLAHGKGDGFFVLLLAIIIIGLVMYRHRQIAGWVGCLALVLILYSLTSVLGALNGVQSEAWQLARDNPFGGLAVAFANNSGLEWGWFPLLGGAATVVAVGLFKLEALFGSEPLNVMPRSEA